MDMDVEQPPAPTIRYDPDPQTRKRKIHCKQELIVSSLQRFYANRQDMQEIIQLLQGTSDVSLRLIDWFVTNYAKTHSTSYVLQGQEFLVYRDYKSQLKAYSKKLFDPFCRRERIYFQLPNQPAFLTTVAKLNFFRWALEKQVLGYIREHQEEIEKEMNSNMKELAKLRSTPTTVSTTGSSTNTVESTATASTRSSTRRRITNKDNVPMRSLQKHTFETEMSFA